MTAIRAYTTIEQSRKLAEILPIESADMVYFGIHQGMDGKYYLSGTNTEDDVVPTYKNLCIKVFEKTTASDVINQLPCWSLAVLLNVLPEYHLSSPNPLGNAYCCRVKDIETYANNPVDACVSMIEKLHELNLL